MKHRNMLAIGGWLIVAAMLTLACEVFGQMVPGDDAAGQSPGQPAHYILFWSRPEQAGSPEEPVLFIHNADGQAEKSLDWSGEEPYGNLVIVDSPGSDQALLTGIGEPAVYLLDLAGDPAAELLELPAGTEDGVIPLAQLGPPAGKWLALGTPLGDAAVLVDTAAGQVVDLLALDADIDRVVSGRFSSTGDHYLAVGNGFWLVPTDSPSAVRVLGPGRVWPGNFSDDGRSLVFVRQAADDQPWEIVIDRLEDGQQEVLMTLDERVFAFFIPGSDRLLLNQGAAVQVIESDGREVKTLATGKDCQRILFGPGGRAAVCQTAVGWQFLELDSGQVLGLSELDGYMLRSGALPGENNWLAFLAEDSRRLVGLDMSSGQVKELLATGGSSESLLPLLTFSADNRFVVGTVPGGGQGDDETWLVDLSTGEERLLRAMNGFPFVTIAPDNCCLIIADRDGQTLLRLDSDEETALGPGLGATWVR